MAQLRSPDQGWQVTSFYCREQSYFYRVLSILVGRQFCRPAWSGVGVPAKNIQSCFFVKSREGVQKIRRIPPIPDHLAALLPTDNAVLMSRLNSNYPRRYLQLAIFFNKTDEWQRFVIAAQLRSINGKLSVVVRLKVVTICEHCNYKS